MYFVVVYLLGRTVRERRSRPMNATPQATFLPENHSDASLESGLLSSQLTGSLSKERLICEISVNGNLRSLGVHVNRALLLSVHKGNWGSEVSSTVFS